RVGPWSIGGRRVRRSGLSRQGASAPDVDLREAVNSQCLVHLGDVRYVMAEDALDDPTASVHSRAGVTDLLIEHLERPSIQTALDDDERRGKRLDQSVRTENVLEVVVTRAVVRGVREPRGI